MNQETRSAEVPGFKIGDRVRVKHINHEVGTIRWTGFLKGDTGCSAGVEYDNPAGWCNGAWEGEQLFHGKNEHCGFAPIFIIKLVKDSKTVVRKSVHVRKFDESVSDVSDMKLKVGEETFYVSKLFLAGQSKYFKSMFLGKFTEASQPEVELKDIDPNVFHFFLEVLHGELVIADDNVKQLLSLDDMYDCETVRRRCEEYLLGDQSKSDVAEKLHLSCRYKLTELNKSCLEKIKTKADIRKSLPSDVTQLDFSTVAELLQKCLNLH